MTTQLTPIAVGDQILSLPTSLVDSIKTSQQRFDAMTEKDEDPEEEEDESDEEEEDDEMSFADKMKAAKAAKASKKDSFDAADVVDHIDSLEAENEVLAALIQQQQHGDAMEDEYEDEPMDDRTPQEIAMELLAEFEEAKPFLSPEARISDYSDIYDIYEDAIGTRYPGALLGEEEMEDDDDRIDPNDADELRGAFKMMCFIANPMKGSPVMVMDSKDADRAFSEALGMRSDSLTPVMPSTPTLKPLY